MCIVKWCVNFLDYFDCTRLLSWVELMDWLMASDPAQHEPEGSIWPKAILTKNI